MNIPNFKNIVQKLNIFKEHSSLLVPVVIGLVGALLFIPTQLMSGKLKEQINAESITKRGKQVTLLSNKAVASRQWIKEQEYQQAYGTDANQIALLAEQSTQRELLSYKIFPEPNDPSTLIFEEFGHRFRGAVEALLARISARDCPTDAEFERALQSSSTGYGPGRSRTTMPRSRRISPRREGRGLYEGRGSHERLSEVEATIEDILCRERAESASVYVNPADLDGYGFWGEYKYAGRDEAIEDCWYYQLAYWITEDVIDTIDAINSSSNSVFTSPVKRLLKISFTSEGRRAIGTRSPRLSRMRRRTRQDTTGDKDRPRYVLNSEDGLTESWTKRLCNDDIDVVHFGVDVVIDSKAVLPFMQELCSAKEHKFKGFFDELEQPQAFKHNQITILETKMESIDREDETHQLYRYGEGAVVELILICEYIFNKNSYDVIKPKSVKESQTVDSEPTSRTGSRRARTAVW